MGKRAWHERNSGRGVGGRGSLSINLALNGLTYLSNVPPVKIGISEEEEEVVFDFTTAYIRMMDLSVRLFTTAERLELPLPRAFCMGGGGEGERGGGGGLRREGGLLTFTSVASRHNVSKSKSTWGDSQLVINFL